ncbi:MULTISPECIES: hypothetical protein [unclassified Streptomyces]|uniref:hypothetical protein n=1 Tax=unclassified Streptomyces TaxID=2593676 RepID=UPI0004C99D82|nr:hypothetical protein [Streptomyces sp. NRRL F-5727]
MAKQGKARSTSLNEVKASLDRASADVDRVLGLQGMQPEGGAATPAVAGFHSTQSIGCSTYSVACGGGGGGTVQM